MKIKPTGNRVLVKVIDVETTTKSGIIITNYDQKGEQTEGTVIAIGDGKILENGTIIKPEVKPGDHVVYRKYSGIKVKDGYVILDNDEILGVKE